MASLNRCWMLKGNGEGLHETCERQLENEHNFVSAPQKPSKYQLTFRFHLGR
jgi:hypothetical protein